MIEKNRYKNRLWKRKLKRTFSNFRKGELNISDLQSIVSRTPRTVLKRNKKSRLQSKFMKLDYRWRLQGN